MTLFTRNFLEFLATAVWLLVLARVVVSFVDPGGRNELSALVIRATEPILAPIRRVLPPTGMLDFSPWVVILLLGVVMRAVGL